MLDITIDVIWNRIIKCEGAVFHQLRGKPYTYEIVGDILIPLGINQNISKTEFEKVLEFLPLSNTTKVQHLRGPSYLYSVLMDERIRQEDDWGSK